MRAYALTSAREAGVSEQWSLKTVWGVGYKFEVVSGA